MGIEEEWGGKGMRGVGIEEEWEGKGEERCGY